MKPILLLLLKSNLDKFPNQMIDKIKFSFDKHFKLSLENVDK